MTIYDLKPAFQNLLRPLVRSIWKLGITPNQITLATCLMSVAFGVFLLLSINIYFYLLPLFFFVRMAFNAIDGMLAKEHNLKTKTGAILNEVTDVISDGFLYFAFARFNFINTHLLFLVIFLAVITEVTGLSALLIGSQRQFAGPMGKSDRAFIFSVMAILITFGIIGPTVMNAILSVVTFLLIVTIVNRARKSLAS